MQEHLSNERLEAYVRRTLGPADLLVAADHLVACEECRLRLRPADPAEAGLTLAVALEPQEPSDHLRYEELEAHVDGALGEVEGELARSHLESCPRCSAEADALDSARRELRPDREYSPAAPLRGVEGGARRWSVLLRAAAVLALAILGVWALRRSGPETARREPAATPAAPPRLVLLDADGRRVLYDDQGHLSGLDAPPEMQARVASAIEARRIAVTDVSELLGAPEQLMGATTAATEFGLVSPVGAVVESARPVLRWRPLAGAKSYKVTVLADDLTPVAESPELRGTEWTPPRDLARGRTYLWQVSASKEGGKVRAPAPPAPEARFRVLDLERAAALAQAREAQPSHLLKAVLLSDAGLVDEARRELAALRDANPGSPLAQALYDSVQARSQRPSPTTTKPAQ